MEITVAGVSTDSPETLRAFGEDRNLICRSTMSTHRRMRASTAEERRTETAALFP
ncbi:MAG TPA: hypothetical protein VEB21_01110 [Terriglobales bacterium]|nr:hypothetical protein [Terriglobales bacterium]